MKREDESSGVRLIRLQELMLEELRGLLRDDIHDPGLADVRLTAMVLSVDYRHARVHFALRGAEDEARARRPVVERALVRATPFLRARLGETIETRRIPDLRFVFDDAAAEHEDA